MKRSRFSEDQIIAILKEQENVLPTIVPCTRSMCPPFQAWIEKSAMWRPLRTVHFVV